MVTVKSFTEVQKEDGSTFYKLILEGGVEPVLSQKSGRFYLTARTCSIASTFDFQTCERLVGTSLKGSVIKVEADPFDYTIPETGEVITLTHKYEYDPYDLMNEENQNKPVKKDVAFA